MDCNPAVVPGETRGRPPGDRHTVVEGTAWRFRTDAPWRDMPERFGNWNTIYKNFTRWTDAGVLARVVETVQSVANQASGLDWVASIDSTVVRVHQYGATLPRVPGRRPSPNATKSRTIGDERPADQVQ